MSRKEKLLLEPDRLRQFPDSFLTFFLTQDDISEVTKVLIRDILEKREHTKRATYKIT